MAIVHSPRRHGKCFTRSAKRRLTERSGGVSRQGCNHARGAEPASALATAIPWGDGATSAGAVFLSPYGTTKEQRMSDLPNKTVLLVDDSPCIRHVCGMELQREGYQVVLASHGKEALAKIGQQPIDLIILDMQMRPTSGFEVLARVRVDHPDIPVIAHTALSEHEVARRSVQMPDAHVQKGGDFSVMKSLVAQLLSSPPAADHAGQARMASCTTSLS